MVENTEKRKLPRMRTIEETYAFLLGEDAETGITKYWIREMCKQNKVHCLKSGSKYLINLDDLIVKLSEGC